MNPGVDNCPRNNAVARAVFIGALLLLVGCASTQARDAEQYQVTSAMPDALIGVWHRTGDEGRKSCNAYKKLLSVDDLSEESNPLIGSLVITNELIHAYAEYGEGDFYAVNRVTALDTQGWRVEALAFVDTMPTEGGEADKAEFLLQVKNGELSMRKAVTAGKSEPARLFFRCGEVIEKLYEDK